jgi:hypothetical protein
VSESVPVNATHACPSEPVVAESLLVVNATAGIGGTLIGADQAPPESGRVDSNVPCGLADELPLIPFQMASMRGPATVASG